MVKIESGEKLWFVPLRRYLGEPKFVTVEKCGRKWLTLDNGFRADVESLIVDGGTQGHLSPAVCFRSKETWEQERALTSAWDAFRVAVDRTRRPGALTIAQIDQARVLLAL